MAALLPLTKKGSIYHLELKALSSKHRLDVAIMKYSHEAVTKHKLEKHTTISD